MLGIYAFMGLIILITGTKDYTNATKSIQNHNKEVPNKSNV
jgi:hypothetical protein